MTPKEKAKELYFAFLNAGKGMTSEYLAGECAYICIDEITTQLTGSDCDADKYYWHEVKKELHKLTKAKE